MTPYWKNPWAASSVYVPLIELAKLIADGTDNILYNEEIQPYTADLFLASCYRFGKRLDAYILKPPKKHPNAILEAGVRYAHAGPRYLSVHIPERNREKALELMRRFAA